MALEINVSPDRKGNLVAEDIEVLPEPRRPKLRGSLTALDRAAGTVTMLGVDIAVGKDAEFDVGSFADLTIGRRAEISCEVDEATGRWSARSFATRDIKSSDKVKGTVTKLFYDGVAPDTLSISGLLILLVEQTDLGAASVRRDFRQQHMFNELAIADASGMRKGHRLADDRMGLRAQYRQNNLWADGFDLTDRYDSDSDDITPELRVKWYGFWTPDLRTLVAVRARQRFYLESDLGLEDEDLEVQLYQAYVLWRNVAGRPLALQVGRQEFEEPREWLYDEYLNAVRAFVYAPDRITVQLAYIGALEPLKEKFDTWTDVLATVDVQVGEDGLATAYYLTRSDSDETRNREPEWWGLRYFGKPVRGLTSWVDLAAMRGEDKQHPLRAWAVDAGSVLTMREWPLSPSLTASYAIGSGDDTSADQVDHEFRQTGYQDNTMRYGGVTSVYYYGAMLDPELSNLEIGTVGFAVRPIRTASLEVLYHTYRQNEPDDGLRGNLIDPPARPNGQSDDIGWGLDVVVGVTQLWKRVKASWAVGLFEPGEAFAPRQDRALLNRLNITVEI